MGKIIITSHNFTRINLPYPTPMPTIYTKFHSSIINLLSQNQFTIHFSQPLQLTNFDEWLFDARQLWWTEQIWYICLFPLPIRLLGIFFFVVFPRFYSSNRITSKYLCNHNMKLQISIGKLKEAKSISTRFAWFPGQERDIQIVQFNI